MITTRVGTDDQYLQIDHQEQEGVVTLEIDYYGMGTTIDLDVQELRAALNQSGVT